MNVNVILNKNSTTRMLQEQFQCTCQCIIFTNYKLVLPGWNCIKQIQY